MSSIDLSNRDQKGCSGSSESDQVATGPAAADLSPAALGTPASRTLSVQKPSLSGSPTKLTSVNMLPSECTPEYALHSLVKFFVKQSTFGYPGSNGSLLSCFYYRIIEEHDILCIFLGNVGHSLTLPYKLLVLILGVSFNFTISALFVLHSCPDYCSSYSHSLAYGLLVSILQFITIKVCRAGIEVPCVVLDNFQKHQELSKTDGWRRYNFLKGVMAGIFSFVTLMLFAMGGTTSGTLHNEHGVDFTKDFTNSLWLTYFVTNPALDCLMVALRRDFCLDVGPFALEFFHQKPTFHSHFDHFFPESDTGCYSLSQIGALGKKNWMDEEVKKGHHPTNVQFLHKFPEFDRKFRL
jgi:hypothetical protein